MSYQPEVDQRMVAAVIRIVNRYTALEPIGRGELVNLVRSRGYDVDERTVREAVEAARNFGQLICSRSGSNGGYYMARDLDEYQEFRQREYMAKATTMLATVKAMDKGAQREFGTVQQGELF